MEENTKEGKPSKISRKRKIWLIIAGALLLVLVAGGIEAYRILYMPQNVFNISAMTQTTPAAPDATPMPTPEWIGPEDTEESNPDDASPTIEPTGVSTSDVNNQKDILNILLIGISSGSGPDPHADGMMVAAINFKEKKVDLISLPRDTFIHVPDIMNGVYKLNASFNVGGGYNAKNGAGFLKVCEVAKYMLGGIPIDYYYGVNFDSVMNLVDTIGGIDYNVEDPAYTNDGISGQRHMDGADVLFYMRVRKVGPEKGDKSRVNRQKKILIAIFDQLVKNGKLSMVPKLLNTANKSIFTNTSLEQTLALTRFMTTIDPKNVGMHSMTGALLNKANWNYCFTDQQARKDLIKQIYGIDVSAQVHCSSRYADWLVQYGFRGIRYLKTVKQMLDYMAAHEAGLTSDQLQAYDDLKASYATAQSVYNRASLTFATNDNRMLADDKNDLKTKATALAKLIGYKDELKWTYRSDYWNDTAINEVRVDFN
jgi:polyisoprenyl-teichoic acid--peptidoglycan teichoic acid transferase